MSRRHYLCSSQLLLVVDWNAKNRVLNLPWIYKISNSQVDNIEEIFCMFGLHGTRKLFQRIRKKKMLIAKETTDAYFC
jgi:hypothetical protein